MTQIDEFESRFKSASKPVFHMEPVTIRKALILLDQGVDQLRGFIDRTRSFLAVLDTADHQVETCLVTGNQFSSVQQLLDRVNEHVPDLICTYRNLHSPAIKFPYSLGVYVDVLTQATEIPILLLPHPQSITQSGNAMRNTDRVMVVTDHLAGDAKLVTYAALFTQLGGQLTLAHVEDRHVYSRFVEVISKIPAIDTETASETIMQQLLKEPRDYIESCKRGIADASLPITINSIITMGDHLSDYRGLIAETEVDLLVFNTKDQDQLAMHGLAYPLSIEFRDIPLLLI